MESNTVDSILVAVEATNLKSVLQLGILRENNELYFVIGKRFQHQTPFLRLDSMRVSTAIDRYREVQRKKKTKTPATTPGEFLKMVFNDFVECSPFKEYVKQSLKPWDLAHLFTRLNKEAPNILLLW